MATRVACPTCGERTEYSPTNKWRPFCSERCKLIDLGAWATEKYSIAGQEGDPDDEPGPDETPPVTPRRPV